MKKIIVTLMVMTIMLTATACSPATKSEIPGATASESVPDYKIGRAHV